HRGVLRESPAEFRVIVFRVGAGRFTRHLEAIAQRQHANRQRAIVVVRFARDGFTNLLQRDAFALLRCGQLPLEFLGAHFAPPLLPSAFLTNLAFRASICSGVSGGSSPMSSGSGSSRLASTGFD